MLATIDVTDKPDGSYEIPDGYRKVKMQDHFTFKDSTLLVPDEKPKLAPGDFVTWFNQGASDCPNPAIVSKVHDKCIEVMCFSPDRMGWRYTSVYHISDPELEARPALKLNNGAWDYSKEHKARMAYEHISNEKLSALSRRVGQLEDLLTADTKPETKGKK